LPEAQLVQITVLVPCTWQELHLEMEAEQVWQLGTVVDPVFICPVAHWVTQ
jgi:hypothetical protein